MRFNNSPKDIQLGILEKWYPIGMKVNRWTTYSTTPSMGTNIYTITGYKDTLAGYRVVIDSSGIVNGEMIIFMESPNHPMLLSPVDEWFKMIRREGKLNRLLK
jgi:hypothetical protein